MSQIERATKRQAEEAAKLLARIEFQRRMRPKPIAVAVRQVLLPKGFQ